MGIKGYEACISQLSCQKTNLKSMPHILIEINFLESNTGTAQDEEKQIDKTKVPQTNK
jgi:hypothetical protein